MAKRRGGDRGIGPDRRMADPQDRAVYIISVAAELAGVHPQTLRIYERKGLLRPARTAGNTRRYSQRDIERLQTIQRLTQDLGVNLAGVRMIVEMEGEIDRMRRRVERMTQEMEAARRRMQQELERMRLHHPSGEIVPLRSVERMRRQIEVRTRERGAPSRGPIAVGPVVAGDAMEETS
jgi:MerR family transcriptional regulator/heat shock protein HspR